MESSDQKRALRRMASGPRHALMRAQLCLKNLNRPRMCYGGRPRERRGLPCEVLRS
jgi:hypothetical protein